MEINLAFGQPFWHCGWRSIPRERALRAQCWAAAAAAKKTLKWDKLSPRPGNFLPGRNSSFSSLLQGREHSAVHSPGLLLVAALRKPQPPMFASHWANFWKSQLLEIPASVSGSCSPPGSLLWNGKSRGSLHSLAVFTPHFPLLREIKEEISRNHSPATEKKTQSSDPRLNELPALLSME